MRIEIRRSRGRAGEEPERRATPALYLFLTAAVSAVLAAAAAGLWFLFAPRLAAWHPFAAAASWCALAALAAAWGAYIAVEGLSARLGKDLLRRAPGVRRALLGACYPLCRAAGRLAGRTAEAVAASFIACSNAMAVRRAARPAGGGLLVLLPRCLQREGCAQAVSMDVRNCRRCGGCDLAKLVPLMERYGFRMAVATGGRLARALVRDLKPSGVIAVACERELLEGIAGIGGIPVVCIANRRPEGPCRNTRVDLGEFEAAVHRFMGGGEGWEG